MNCRFKSAIPTGTARCFLAFALLSIASCGFHLRGQASFPFHTLYINAASNSPISRQLARILSTNVAIRLVDKPDEAEAIFDLTRAPPVDKLILTLSGGGKVREFLLVQTVGFTLHDGKGGNWLPYAEFQIKRDFSYTDSEALAKEAEERLLISDMENDAAQQIVRRLQAAHKPLPE